MYLTDGCGLRIGDHPAGRSRERPRGRAPGAARRARASSLMDVSASYAAFVAQDRAEVARGSRGSRALAARDGRADPRRRDAGSRVGAGGRQGPLRGDRPGPVAAGHPDLHAAVGVPGRGPGGLAAHVAGERWTRASRRRAGRARRAVFCFVDQLSSASAARLPDRAVRGGRRPGAVAATNWSSCCCRTAPTPPPCAARGPGRLAGPEHGGRGASSSRATRSGATMVSRLDAGLPDPRRARTARRDRAGPGRAGAPAAAGTALRGRRRSSATRWPWSTCRPAPASPRWPRGCSRRGRALRGPGLRRRAPRRDHRAPRSAAARCAAAQCWRRSTRRRRRLAERLRETLRLLAAPHG